MQMRGTIAMAMVPRTYLQIKAAQVWAASSIILALPKIESDNYIPTRQPVTL